MEGTTTQEVSYKRADGLDCPAYLAQPAAPSSIGFVVIQEWWGVNETIKKLACDAVAGAGYRALIPDLYRGKVAVDHEEAGHLFSGLDWPGAVADIHAAAKYLKETGSAKVVAIGFCMGGALTLAAAALNGDVTDAGVCFYGIPKPELCDVKTIKVPIQLHFGNNDDHVGFSDPSAADALEASLKEGNMQYESHRYPGRGHAFMNSSRNDYDSAFAAAVWKSVYAFVEKHLGPKVHISESVQALSADVGDFIAALSADAVKNRGKFTVAFSGGSLPNSVAPKLVSALKNSIEWVKWQVFFSDERYTSPDDKESNYKACNDALFSHVGLPAQNVHILDHKVSLAEAATKYQNSMKEVFGNVEWPQFDLILLGMGPDGHTCSLFPFHPLLEEKSIWIAPISDSPKPPPERITMTLPVLNHARVCAFVAAGDAKKEMLVRVLEKKHTLKEGELPSALVAPRAGEVHWFIDQPAAALLSTSKSASL